MKLIITIILAIIFASVLSSILFGLINSVIHLPAVINHYGGLLLMIWILVQIFGKVKRFVQSNF